MTKNFRSGFIMGLALFVVINLLAAHLSSDCGLPAVFGRDSCADDIARAGWPLRFYEKGGFDSRDIFNLGKLGLDLIAGILTASAMGWFFNWRLK